MSENIFWQRRNENDNEIEGIYCNKEEDAGNISWNWYQTS